ncbi:hypothetical protein [Mycoplasma miroungirhinis]|uniref:Lipoprotein n=1 Tax=Mycoplasma miroungirhinis TaxID=754516 RepID=A0A6M4JGI6_9MOLU|nr:hypothetical protein [Mycoplasma miroungirhinis]QJR44152.1 hypothetical protein HLA92_01750 [Mycoplasma miroungirhinis]
MKNKFLKPFLLSVIGLPTVFITVSCANSNQNTQSESESNKFTQEIKQTIDNSDIFLAKEKETLNQFLVEFKDDKSANAKQIFEQKIIDFILQKSQQSRQFFLLVSILVQFSKIYKDIEFSTNLDNLLKHYQTLRNISSIIKQPNIVISTEDIKTFNTLFKTVINNVQITQYQIQDKQINRLEFKQNQNISLSNLTETEIKDIENNIVFNLKDNVLKWEVFKINPKDDEKIKNQLLLSLNLERDLEISKIKNDALIYLDFKTIDDDFIENKNPDIQLSNFYNETFFKNNILVYLSVEPIILTNDDKLIAIYKIPFTIQDNQIVNKTQYIQKSISFIDLNKMKIINQNELMNLLKGIYIELPKNINLDVLLN